MNELIMLVGLPASGKSTWAKEYSETHPDYIVHSSDKLREEMYGDNYDDADNSKVFEELHRRILEDLKMHSVIYDATNLVKKRRVHFLKGVPKHVYKTCIMFLKTYEKCLKDNSKRENSVPDEVITRMRKVFSPPMYHEGFNEIRVVQDDHKDIKELIDMARDFDQEYDAFYTANLIYYHMHPYLSWSQSNKAKNKDKYLIGKQMFSDVMLLHEADVKGH